MIAESAPDGAADSRPSFRFSTNNLDIVRLLAATDVAIKHGMVHLGVAVEWSEWLGLVPGVPIFFFVSGFLIYRSYQNAPNLRVFATNRFLRLYPGLIACLIVSLLLLLATGYLSPQRLFTTDFFAWIVAQSTALQFYNWDHLRGFGTGVINGSLWTISVELQFYALTPFLFWILGKRRKAMAAVIAALVAVNLWFILSDQTTTAGKLTMVSFAPWLYMFLAGAYVSTNENILHWIINQSWWKLFVVYFTSLIASLIFGIPFLGNNISPLLFFPVAALVVKAAYSAPTLSGELLNRNDVSYGVYIYHMPIINGLLFYGLSGRTIWLVVAMALTAVLAAASWFLIERPALARKTAALRAY